MNGDRLFSPRKLKGSFLLLVLFASGLFPVRQSNRFPGETEDFTLTLTAPLPQVKSKATIQLDGFEPLNLPGYAPLPGRIVDVALPPDADPRSVQIEAVSQKLVALNGVYDLPGLTKPEVYQPGVLPESYSVKNNLSQAAVTLLSTGQMRKWRFARILYSPVLTRAETGLLSLASEVQVKVTYHRQNVENLAIELQDGLMDQTAAQRFYNYPQAQAWYPATVPARPTYVIATTQREVSGSAALPEFVNHMIGRGFNVRVVTEKDYGPSTPYTPEAIWDIRQWLQNHYLSDHIQYVLLIGYPLVPKGPEYGPAQVVPMLHCFPRSHQSSFQDIYTDTIYADLTGNWDLDGDGSCGEFPDDGGPGGVDFAPEVYVGRINVYAYRGWEAELDKTLRKIIRYENQADHTWRKSALVAMSFTGVDQDNAWAGEALKNEILSPAGFSVDTFYQHMGSGCNSIFTSTHDLVNLSVDQQWQAQPYGWVTLTGHGNAFGSISVGYSADGYSNCKGGLMTDMQTSRGLDDQHPAFVYAGSCYGGFPEITETIGSAYLRNGAVGVFGGGGTVWGTATGWSPSHATGDLSSLGYYLAQEMLSGETAGKALYTEKEAMGFGWGSDSWQNLMAYSLFGSPATAMFPEARPPQDAQQLKAAALSQNEIELSWEDWSDNEDGFKLERSTDGIQWQEVANLPSNSILYKDQTVQASTTYFFRIKAYNAAGDSNYAGPVSVKTGDLLLFLPVIQKSQP